MAKISSKRRHIQIKQKHKRKIKLKKLRTAYAASRSTSEREKIWEKAHKISSLISKEEFLKPIEKTAKKSSSKGKSVD